MKKIFEKINNIINAKHRHMMKKIHFVHPLLKNDNVDILSDIEKELSRRKKPVDGLADSKDSVHPEYWQGVSNGLTWAIEIVQEYKNKESKN